MCLSLLIVVCFLAGYACCRGGIPYSGTSPGPSCLAHLLMEKWTLCAESYLAAFPSGKAAKECLMPSPPRWDWVWACLVPKLAFRGPGWGNFCPFLPCFTALSWLHCRYRQDVLAAFSSCLSDFKRLDKVYRKKCAAISAIAMYKLLKYQGCLNLQAICCARKCGF